MKYIFYVLLFLAGFVTASFFEEKLDVEEFETKVGGYEFISPLRACDTSPTNIKNKKITPIKEKVETLIKNNKDKADIVAVYYRDLSNGPWFGINENHKFASASLGKIPVMIMVYKIAEINPNFLKSTLTNNGQYDIYSNLTEEVAVTKGQELLIEDVVRFMIANSDNIATKELKDLISSINLDSYKSVYSDLGLDVDFEKEALNITAKKMGSLFRILYNATYLNEKYSERALKIMSEGTFNEGIKKHIPNNVKVANKFGVRKYTDSPDIHFHDCGIVYYPSNPYLICIMTKGQDEASQVELIAQISKTIYDHLSESIVYK